MSDATFMLKKRVEYDMELTLEQLPFGMSTYDIDNFMEVRYDMDIGEVIVVELNSSSFENKLIDYKKRIPTEGGETLFADEYCMIKSVKHNGGVGMYYELIIPLQEDWEEVYEDETEVALDVY